MRAARGSPKVFLQPLAALWQRHLMGVVCEFRSSPLSAGASGSVAKTPWAGLGHEALNR